MNRALFLAILFAAVAFAQTAAVTAPTSGQVVSGTTTLLTCTPSSAPSTWRTEFYINGKYFNAGYLQQSTDTISSIWNTWYGPFTVQWWPPLLGDGAIQIYCIAKDFAGTTLATSPTVTFYARTRGMSNSTLSTVTTTGAGPFVLTTWDGSTNKYNCGFYIDGRFHVNGDDWYGANSGCTWGYNSSVYPLTYRFPNGLREIFMPISGTQSFTEPLIASTTVTSNGSGTTLTATNHQLFTGKPVVFSTTGTLPVPLVAGTQWFWGTSTTNPSNTITAISVSAGVLSITTSGANGLSNGSPFYVFNSPSTNQTNGKSNCDGLYTVTGTSGNTFTAAAGTCPTGTLNKAFPGLEVDTFPYFAIYVGTNSIGVSSTPGGAAITFTSTGSGTNTVSTRLRDPFYIDSNADDLMAPSPALSFGYTTATFSNGSHTMEIRPPYWEYHGWPGKTGDTLCPVIENTDLSTSTPSCTSFVYTAVTSATPNNGGVSVASNGAITYGSSPLGWARYTVGCTACDTSGSSMPNVTVDVQNQPGSNSSWPTFTTCGTIAASFQTGSCPTFSPLSMWQLTLQDATTYQGNPAARSLWLGPVLNASNINATQEGMIPSNLADPGTTSCPSANNTLNNDLLAYANTYHLSMSGDFESVEWPAYQFAAFTNNLGFNRQSCLQTAITYLKANNYPLYYLFGHDENNAYNGGETPLKTYNVGTTNFTGCSASSGVMTCTVLMTMLGPWNQTFTNRDASGDFVRFTGGTTNSCMNGWQPITSESNPAAGYQGTTTVTTITFNTTCSNGTINATSDPSLVLNYNYISTSNHITGTTTTGGITYPWSSALTSMVSNGTTLTVNWTNYATATAIGGVNGLGTSFDSIMIQGATNTNLQTVAAITPINANSFSIPTLMAAGTYNASTDPNLYITVDPNLAVNRFAILRSVLTAGATAGGGQFAKVQTMLGSSMGLSNVNGVYNWEADPNLVDAALDYAEGGCIAFYGWDCSVMASANATQGLSALQTRAFQVQPRNVLYGIGPTYTSFHRGFTFNPAIDRPQVGSFYFRPESVAIGISDAITNGQISFKGYNWYTDGNIRGAYAGNIGFGTSTGSAATNHYTDPNQWQAQSHVFALINTTNKFLNQPPLNSPYLGPMFKTTAHSGSYGALLWIACESEMPYGAQTVSLAAINQAGGTMRKYVLNGQTLTVTPLAGNPTSVSYNGCATGPGETTVYVGQVAGANDLDTIAMGPPPTMPYGASKMFVRYGYYPYFMDLDPAVDCTSGCTITVDDHNINAYYQVDYVNTSGSTWVHNVGDPVTIPSKGGY
jgi:hypothetical protein